MIYKNPKHKKMKNSRILFILCGHCKTEIAIYQKVGKGNLLKMHIERVISGSINFAKVPKALHCPNCNEHLATRTTLKGRNKEVYRMVRGVFNTREGSR